MAEQLITLCESCAEKMREKYILTELGWAPGCCTWLSCGNAPVKQYKFVSKEAARQRQQAERNQMPKRDSRAYWRGGWREET
jgi:hypothetical protein